MGRQQTQSLAASIAIGLLLIYFIITNHVDLAPLNNLAAAGSQLPSTLMAVIPFGMVLLGLRLERGRWIYAGWIWSMVWLLLQIRQWWLPYLFGPTFLHENFAWYFQHGYARDQARVSNKWGTHTRPTTQYLAGVVAWSGTDPVVEGADTIKE